MPIQPPARPLSSETLVVLNLSYVFAVDESRLLWRFGR
jgi:hypothetical protein